MPTTYSDENGMVVRATDNQGTYYYLADTLGTPTEGAWTNEEHAIARLQGDGPEPDLEMDGRGNRLTPCAYCGLDVVDRGPAPAAEDNDAWADLANEHDDDCDWVLTRAFRRDP